MDLTRDATDLAATLPGCCMGLLGTLEMPELHLEPCQHTTSTIYAVLTNPTASALFTVVHPAVLDDQALEIECRGVGFCRGARGPASFARCLSAHARLSVVVMKPGQSRIAHSVPLTARPSDCGWICRALIHPAEWADAASVTVHSLSLAGRSLTCDRLPATLRVGYSHAPSPAGEVLAAAKAGDVPALQAALGSGGSTEEATRVRVELCVCHGANALWHWPTGSGFKTDEVFKPCCRKATLP